MLGTKIEMKLIKYFLSESVNLYVAPRIIFYIFSIFGIFFAQHICVYCIYMVWRDGRVVTRSCNVFVYYKKVITRLC